MHVSRKGGEHTIRELEVVTLLTLDNTKVTIDTFSSIVEI